MKIVMLHGYSDSNKGDLAIVVASIDAIQQLYPESEITLQSVYSRRDHQFEEHHRFVSRLGIRVEPMPIPSPYLDERKHSLGRNLWAMLRLATDAASEWLVRHAPVSALFPTQAAALQSIRMADVVLLKGGQYIYNDQGGLRGWLYLWRVLHPVIIAAGWGRPMIMLGQSVGPLQGPQGREMARRALGRCQCLVVREELSRKLMGELGLEKSTIQAPDMAFLTRPRLPSGSRNVAELLIRMAEKPFLGVTVVNWSYPGATDVSAKRKAYEAALESVCLRVSQEMGMGVVLLPQVTVRHHGESDMDVIDRLSNRLLQAGVDVHTVVDDLWPDEFSHLYSQSRVLLGTRLHSCILAACGHCPVVAIRYQGFKTEGVMADLGMGEYVHDISTVDGDALYQSIRQADAQHDMIQTALKARVAEYRTELYRIIGAEIARATGQEPQSLLSDITSTARGPVTSRN